MIPFSLSVKYSWHAFVQVVRSQMSSAITTNVWLRAFIIDAEGHSILIRAFIESFNLAICPGHHFFAAKVTYYLYCSNSTNALEAVKQILGDALQFLVPQIDCDLDNEAW